MSGAFCCCVFRILGGANQDDPYDSIAGRARSPGNERPRVAE